MVASSRSSLRRPNLRGDHTARSRSSSPESDNIASNKVREISRTKRTRIASVSGREQLQKRRRIAAKSDGDEISIPLRGKGAPSEAVSGAVFTRSIPTIDPIVTQNTASDSNSPLQSPTPKAQYDQIKRIEEKARAAIHGGGPNNSQKDDRRKLRSEHGGTRSKTELAQYFTAFEEMLSLESPNPDILTAKTRIILIDDTPSFQSPSERPDSFGANKSLHDVVYINLASLLSLNASTEDPMGPEMYFKAHRKAERHEKQMKNGDKERAQHEKYQLERLLDELRGPDWLKTLGITGITDSEKKRYEPKRALFIRETRALIDKFKRWKEEEKRRKAEREQVMLDETTEAEEGEMETSTEKSATSTKKKGRKHANGRGTSLSPSVASSDKGPDSSEIDALASRQLLQEAKLANLRRKRTSGLEVPAVLPEVYKPFTSFFDKRHIRDAAVAGRQRGRTVLAFGEPVTDLPEIEFELPDSILTEDAIRASQRNRRRVKRNIDE